MRPVAAVHVAEAGALESEPGPQALRGALKPALGFFGPGVHGGAASPQGAPRCPSVAPLRVTPPPAVDAAHPGVPGLELTPRESRVLDLASHGWATVQIARDLGVSPRTVTDCLTGLFAKAAVPNRAGLVGAGFRLGLLAPVPWRGRPPLDPSVRWLAPLLPLIAAGFADVELAEHFGCGASAVRSRVYRLHRLLAALGRAHAVRLGVEAALLVVSPDGARLVLAGPASGGVS